jgi:hypothetical protein
MAKEIFVPATPRLRDGHLDHGFDDESRRRV